MSGDSKKLTTSDIGHHRITDAEAVSMARFLVQRDGLFLGSSSAVNLVACVKLARKMGWSNGEKIVTVLCVFPSSYPTLHSPVANDVVNFFFRGAARASISS